MKHTPRTDALLLEINEGRTYDQDGPIADLCREFEHDRYELAKSLIELLAVSWERAEAVLKRIRDNP